jgi:hypothetical protein
MSSVCHDPFAVALRTSFGLGGAGRGIARVEALERRALMATITGTVLRDVTGNGLSPDDQPLAGVVVRLFKDVNANGRIDAPDGAARASRTSAAGTGAFAFAGLATGKYLLKETPGSNQVRTAPVLKNTIAVNVTNTNGTYNGNVFANYVKSFQRSAVSNISYTINGTKTVSSLDGNVTEGDTVTVNFTVAAGKTVRLTLVVYHASGPNGGSLPLQEIADVDTGLFSAGRHSLSVDVPDCYFQIDFVGGFAINRFGPSGSNIRYGAQGRLIAAESGGTKVCADEEIGREGLTPGFWKNHTNVWGPTGLSPNQTLESVFNVPDSLGLDNKTLLQALGTGGGGVSALFRQAVAAVLNAAHPLVDYPLTASSIVSQVNTALASGNKNTIESLKDQLDSLNNLGGGIDAHGRPI